MALTRAALLWPIKKNTATKSVGLTVDPDCNARSIVGGKTFGFSGGRDDIWAPEEDIGVLKPTGLATSGTVVNAT